MKTYRIALIGCGQMGSAHLDDIYYREDIRITYVCDLNAEKASAFKRKYHAENILSDYRECISREDVDIVIRPEDVDIVSEEAGMLRPRMDSRKPATESSSTTPYTKWSWHYHDNYTGFSTGKEREY